MPSRVARRASEKPLRFRRYTRSASSACRLLCATSASSLIRSSICTRNQGSTCECSYTSCTLMPRRKASPMYQIRSERGVRSSEITLSLLAGSFRSTFGSKPVEPTSRPRRAFCRDSCCVRPIAITSPTDFIWVVRRPSACGNFSKVKRGILVTT